MQAVTMAIGKQGITHFVQQLLAGKLVSVLGTLKPADKRLQVPDFGNYGAGYSDDFWNIWISLSNGSLSGFTPAFQSVAQQPGGKFALALSAGAFRAQYSWNETYHENFCSTSTHGTNCHGSDHNTNFGYGPGVGSLAVALQMAFVYDAASKSYQMKVLSSAGTSQNTTANIPAGSVIQNQDQGCFTAHVSDATAQSVSSIDFGTPIGTLFQNLVQSIPASGQLTADITYEYALGDSGLAFPGDDGIAIGVTGTVKYQGTEYPGTKPAALPVPPPPADSDTHHLQVYVSSYEMNALHWAYYQAGLLNVTVHPDDLPDPDVLKVKTYVTMIPALKPYLADAMTATVAPKAAPTMSFQNVWILSKSVMAALKTSLPANVYQQISGLDGDAYVTVAELDADLSAAGVAAQYVTQIETAAKSVGMVVTQNLGFTLTIENGAPTKPVIVFDVARTDVLQNLGLGKSGTAQTLKYAFTRVVSTPTFVSSTVPNFPGAQFAFIWAVTGEPGYDKALTDMGTGGGVPIPIMSGFQFVFDQAVLSVQEGYVSILAQVEYKSGT
jgi:hypothetical protein